MDFLVSDLVEGLIVKLDKVDGLMVGNVRQLAIHDADVADDYIIALETQIEETEFELLNADEWLDDEVDACITEFESGLTNFPDITGQDKGMLINVIEQFGHVLKDQLNKKAQSQLHAVKKVYGV